MEKIKKLFVTLLIILPVSLGVNFFIIPASVSAATQMRITEIMYDPSGDGSREFLEFYNGSDSAVNLGGWSTVGVDFVFPGGTLLPAKNYTVIVRNLSAFRATHPGARIAGQYSGKLRGSGELVALINSVGQTVSQTSYTFGGAWPTAPRNGGPSLSLIRPTANESQAACWGSSTASGGSPSYANSSTGGGGGCGDVAYATTPKSAATPTPSGGGSTATVATPEEKKAEEMKKKQAAKKEAEQKLAEKKKQEEAQKSVEAQVIQIRKKQEVEKKSRLLGVIATIVILAGVGVGGFFLRKYLLKKDAKIVLQKGKSDVPKK